MALDTFLEGQTTAGRGLSVGPRTGFGDVFGAGLTNEWVNPRNFGGAMQYRGLPLNERNDKIKQRFGQDVFEVTGINKKYPNPTTEGRIKMLEEANSAVDSWIMKGRTEDPAKYDGIKTTAEIMAEYKRVIGANEKHFQEMQIRNPNAVSRTVGGVLGSVTGAIADPVNIASLPFGAGEIKAGLRGWSAARAIMKAAAIDGSINATIEAFQQPLAMKWSEELGRRYGIGDAAESVGMAFFGGAGLSGLIRGLGRGVDYAGSVSMDVLDRIASSERLPQSVRSAARFMSRQAHIDESAPPGLVKTGEDLKTHRQEAQRIADEFENYQSPAISSSDSMRASPENNVLSDTGAGSQVSPERLAENSVPSSFSRTAKVSPSSSKAMSTLGTIDTTSQSTIYHTTKKVDNLLKKAAALLPELDQLTTRLSEGIEGLKSYPGRVKTKDSLAEKMRRKGRDADTMPDILGGRLVADTPKAIYDAVDALNSTARVIEVDDKLSRASGYRAVHVIVTTDKGISAEIQIQPKEIREVQDFAHENYYKKYTQYDGPNGNDFDAMRRDGVYDQFKADMAASDQLFDDAWSRWEERTGGKGSEDMSDIMPTERIQPVDLPEGLTPEVSADRVAIAEADMKGLVDELGDNVISLDDGRSVSIRDFAEEVQAKKKIIEAMKTCRIA